MNNFPWHGALNAKKRIWPEHWVLGKMATVGPHQGFPRQVYPRGLFTQRHGHHRGCVSDQCWQVGRQAGMGLELTAGEQEGKRGAEHLPPRFGISLTSTGVAA